MREHIIISATILEAWEDYPHCEANEMSALLILLISLITCLGSMRSFSVQVN